MQVLKNAIDILLRCGYTVVILKVLDSRYEPSGGTIKNLILLTTFLFIMSTVSAQTYNLYDQYGNLIGTTKDSRYDPSRTDYYDQQGNLIGSEKASRYDPGTIIIYDQYGNQIGSRKIDPFK